MASLIRFGFLLLLLAFVASAKPREEISQQMFTNEQTIANIESTRKIKRELNNLREDIVGAINQRRFAYAEDKLLKGNSVELSEIVGDVYQNSESNVQVILDFAKSLSNTNLKYGILTSLYEQWKQNGQTDTLKKIALAKAYSDIIGDAKIVPDAFESLLDDVTTSTIDRLFNILKLKEDYGNNEEAKVLATAIVGLRDVPKKMMLGLLEKATNKVHDTKLFQLIYTHSDPWQALIGIDHAINELQKVNRLKKSHPFNLASALNKIKSTANFDSAQSQFLDLTIKKIPKCYMNLISLPEFCIRANQTDSYLALQNTGDNVTPIVAIPRSQVNDANRNTIKWKSRLIEYVVYFESPYYTNSVIASSYYPRDRSLRLAVPDTSKQVYTYKAVNDSSFKYNYNGFIIIPVGDTCLLRTSSYFDGQYIHTSDESVEDSVVFKKVTLERNVLSKPTFWEITEC